MTKRRSILHKKIFRSKILRPMTNRITNKSIISIPSKGISALALKIVILCRQEVTWTSGKSWWLSRLSTIVITTNWLKSNPLKTSQQFFLMTCWPQAQFYLTRQRAHQPKLAEIKANQVTTIITSPNTRTHTDRNNSLLPSSRPLNRTTSRLLKTQIVAPKATSSSDQMSTLIAVTVHILKPSYPQQFSHNNRLQTSSITVIITILAPICEKPFLKSVKCLNHSQGLAALIVRTLRVKGCRNCFLRMWLVISSQSSIKITVSSRLRKQLSTMVMEIT